MLQKNKRTLQNLRITKTFIFWILGWLVFSVVFYNVMTIKHEEKSLAFDPYEVLGVTHESDESTVKKAYRKLSLKWYEHSYFYFLLFLYYIIKYL